MIHQASNYFNTFTFKTYRKSTKLNKNGHTLYGYNVPATFIFATYHKLTV